MLHEIVAEAADRFGDRPAVVGADGTTTSYVQLWERARATATGLVAAGVRPGDRVVLRMPSVVEYVEAYAGASAIGAVTAGINPSLSPGEQDTLEALADPTIVLRDADSVRALRRTGAPEIVAPDPSRLVALVFTSGTTGTPKAAMFGGDQLAAVRRIDTADAWGGDARIPMLAGTQFAHIGFTTKLPWYLAMGTTQFLLDRWRASTVLELVARERMTSIGGIAPQFALLLRAPESRTLDVSCVTQLIAGGAASPPALVREARAVFGADYSIRYSSTESGGCGTGTAFDADDDEALHSVGRPRGGIEVRVVEPDGTSVPHGEVGELVLRSPSMLRGYWRNEEATADALRDGWLFTGDLAEVDATGLVRLRGRRKEMYIRGGYNVFPAAVESVLGEHPSVADVAIVPREDDVMGEVGVAVVVPRGDAPTLDSLRSFAAERVARYALPEDLRIVDALPLTAMHKLDRAALARLVSEA